MSKPLARKRRSASRTTRSDDQPEVVRSWMVAAAAITIALAWGYLPTILDLIEEWQDSQDYSVGALVPFAAVYLVWLDRRRLRECAFDPSWLGVGVLLFAQGVRLFGLLFVFQSAERYSLVITIAGLVLLVLGREVFWQLRWILLFLFLMVPLPGKVHNAISGPLQGIATEGAVVFLELFGITVSREGNVIVLNENVPVAVAEACSGLRMLTAFVVVAATLAYVVNRPAWQKTLLVVSSVPIAILCNLVRLFATALLYLVASSQMAERFFHDFAGLTMMPLAVLLLAGELIVMKHLVVPEEGPQKYSERAEDAARRRRKRRK